MNKTRVINLVGGSGSGKSSVAKELEGLGYNVIQSFTTREMRYEGEWGHEFVNGWLDEDDMGVWIEYCGDTELVPWESMIAYFNSYKSNNHYFATYHEVIGGQDNLYIVDPLGARQVHDYYEGSEVDVITIYLQVDEQIRAERLARRASNGYCFTPKDNPEVWSRIRPDRKIFEVVEADYTVNGNGGLDHVTDLVLGIIENN